MHPRRVESRSFNRNRSLEFGSGDCPLSRNAVSRQRGHGSANPSQLHVLFEHKHIEGIESAKCQRRTKCRSSDATNTFVSIGTKYLGEVYANDRFDPVDQNVNVIKENVIQSAVRCVCATYPTCMLINSVEQLSVLSMFFHFISVFYAFNLQTNWIILI